MFNLLITRFLFSLAYQIQSVAMGWQVYALLQKPIYLGLIGLAEAIPALGLALIAGDIVDRSNPIRTTQWVYVAGLLSALTVLGTSLFHESLSLHLQVGLIYFAAFLTGVARSFSAPSFYALVPHLVERRNYSSFSAWSTSTFHFAVVGGPAFAGIIYSLWGASITYALGSLLMVGAFFAMRRIQYSHRSKANMSTESFKNRLAQGIRFVFKHDVLLSSMALDMLAVLFGGVTALLPVFAGEILNVGPRGLGYLRAAPAVGALLMSLWLVRYPITKRAGAILLWVVAGFGISMIGFGLSRSYELSLFFLALGGALDSVSMVVRAVFLNIYAPDEMRGRIAAVNAMFIGSSNELGAFESGLAAQLLGTIPSVIFGGLMTLVVVGYVTFKNKTLRNLHITPE